VCVGVRSTVGVQYEVDKRYWNVSRALAARWIYQRATCELITNNIVTGLALVNLDEPLECEACIKAKLVCQEIASEHEGERATTFGQEIWSDVWGPAKVPTLGGQKYFVSFTDDHSRWLTVYLLETKDVFKAYKSFEAWVATHLNVGIACLHSDHGGEYMSRFLSHIWMERGQ
jgi:hypothetical protein